MPDMFSYKWINYDAISISFGYNLGIISEIKTIHTSELQ